MRLKEQRLWDTFKRHIPSTVWAQRVENIVADGMPDVYYKAERSQEVWIELKSPTRPKRASTPLMGEKEGARQSQKNWHRTAQQVGIRSGFLIRDSEGELFLVPGSYADEINKFTLAEMREASIASDWESIIKLLGQ